MMWNVFAVNILIVFLTRAIIGLEAPVNTTTAVSQSYFAICLIIKNDYDIIEWIDYHRKMGCSKFYVNDHSSDPPLNTTILSYIKSGLVEYTYYQGSFKPNPQIKVYQDCIDKYKDKHTFMVTLENFICSFQQHYLIQKPLLLYD